MPELNPKVENTLFTIFFVISLFVALAAVLGLGFVAWHFLAKVW
jgi:F0F1-type ATP synthase membrane subunit c/vacuolar-type H+-ATPase subunit K